MEVKWIKITTDIFDDEKIKLIDSMPERDTILVIWLKILTLAGKSNRTGYLLFSDNIPYDEEMLSTLFNRPLNSIRLAIGTFKKFKMITVEHFEDTEDDKEIFYISNWEKHQNVEGMEKLKIQWKEASKRYRENKKLEHSMTSYDGTYDVIEQNKNKNKNIDKDKDIEKEIYKEKEKNNTPHSPQGGEYLISKDVLEVLDYLNLKTNKKFSIKNKNNIKNISQRLKDGFTVEELKSVIDKKTLEWLNDDKMNQFLNPETLFRPKKFEIYLNSKNKVKTKTEDDDGKYKNIKTTHIDNVTGEMWVTGG